MTFGFHTILSVIAFTILFNFFYEKNILECFISVLKSFILIAVFEIFTLNILFYLTNKNTAIITNNFLLRTVGGLIYVGLMFLTGFIILHVRRKKEIANEEE
jgi:hypothetical protein